MNGSIDFVGRVDKHMSVDATRGQMSRVGCPRNRCDLAGMMLPQVFGHVHVLGAHFVALDTLGIVGNGQIIAVRRKANSCDEITLGQRQDLDESCIVDIVESVDVAFVVATAHCYGARARRDRDRRRLVRYVGARDDLFVFDYQKLFFFLQIILKISFIQHNLNMILVKLFTLLMQAIRTVPFLLISIPCGCESNFSSPLKKWS